MVSKFNIFFFILFCPVIITLGSCKKKSKEADPENSESEVINMKYIKADNEAFEYYGRFDFSDPTNPIFSWPGVSIKANFQGKAVDVVMGDYAVGGDVNTNYFDIYLDGSLAKVLKITDEDTLYNISRSLNDGSHTIEIFRRTEGFVGKSSFKGIRIDKTKSMMTSSAKPSRKIEIIGDSYSAAYGNEVSIPAPPDGNPRTGFHSVNENNYKSWGAMMARNLNAQYSCIARSGFGMYRDYDGNTSGVLPDIYTRIHSEEANPTWNTANYIPDVILIHLGGNDTGPEDATTPNMLDSASFVNKYINFITTLRTYYPNATIVCVTTNTVTNSYPVGLKTLTRMKKYTKAAADYHINNGDSKVHNVIMTTVNTAPYGENWHPTITIQKKMADEMTPYVKNLMSW